MGIREDDYQQKSLVFKLRVEDFSVAVHLYCSICDDGDDGEGGKSSCVCWLMLTYQLEVGSEKYIFKRLVHSRDEVSRSDDATAAYQSSF